MIMGGSCDHVLDIPYNTSQSGLASYPGPLREEKGPGTHCLHMCYFSGNLYFCPFIIP